MPDLFDCLLRPLEELVDFLEVEFLACRRDRGGGIKGCLCGIPACDLMTESNWSSIICLLSS